MFVATGFFILFYCVFCVLMPLRVIINDDDDDDDKLNGHVIMKERTNKLNFRRGKFEGIGSL